MGNVDQVCPISKSRLLFFGSTIPGAYEIAIVDQGASKLVDLLDAYDPVVSPNQRWMVFRDFYAPQSDVPFSEEYLLYDLTKDKTANRMPGLTLYTADVAGRVVYPQVNQGSPFEHSGLKANQTHRFRSDSFYWATDSRAVVFADSVQTVLSVVLLVTNNDDVHAYVHPLAPTEACEQGEQGDVNTSELMISHAIVGLEQDGSRTIELQTRSSDYGACRPKQLILRLEDFKPASIETHEPPQGRKESVAKQP